MGGVPIPMEWPDIWGLIEARCQGAGGADEMVGPGGCCERAVFSVMWSVRGLAWPIAVGMPHTWPNHQPACDIHNNIVRPQRLKP
jgi:hypothetical protein